MKLITDMYTVMATLSKWRARVEKMLDMIRFPIHIRKAALNVKSILPTWHMHMYLQITNIFCF